MDAWTTRTHGLIHTPVTAGMRRPFPSTLARDGASVSVGIGACAVSHLRDTVRLVARQWTHWDSNPGHPPCKGGTLPLSYGPTPSRGQLASTVQRCPIGRTVGRSNADRVAHRATSCHSGRNRCIRWVGPSARSRSVEVIQPQIPLRLPCYDLSPLAKPRFDRRCAGLIRTSLGCFDGRCVQGAGTYSPRPSEARLLPNPAS